MSFPQHRLRRLRLHSGLRAMLDRVRPRAAQFVYPVFVQQNFKRREEVPSMPGVFRQGPEQALAELTDWHRQGLAATILFGIPSGKDGQASGAWDDEGVVQETARLLRRELPDLLVIADTCLCEYMSHGHCGPIRGHTVDNDAALELLARTAVSQARAGAQIIAPSDMMDGRVARIRGALDGAGFADTPILSYAAKYASACYGPFRDAADSAPSFGDRKSYQMDPSRGVEEALRETALDLDEGADMVMVKPALPYLDVIAAVRARFEAPVVAYQVSGEYAMIKAAALQGWIDEERVVAETLVAILRAGADLVITYHAPLALRLFGGM